MTPEDYNYTYLGTFYIPGKCRTKSNEKFKNRRLSDEMRAWEDGVGLLAKVALGVQGLAVGWIIVQPYFQNKKHPDLSNLTKSVFDGIVKGGVFKDDKYVASTVLPAVYGHGDKTGIIVWGQK